MYRVIEITYSSGKQEWVAQRFSVTGWKNIKAGGKFGLGAHDSLQSAESVIDRLQKKKRKSVYKPWYLFPRLGTKKQEAGNASDQ